MISALYLDSHFNFVAKFLNVDNSFLADIGK